MRFPATLSLARTSSLTIRSKDLYATRKARRVLVKARLPQCPAKARLGAARQGFSAVSVRHWPRCFLLYADDIMGGAFPVRQSKTILRLTRSAWVALYYLRGLRGNRFTTTATSTAANTVCKINGIAATSPSL